MHDFERALAVTCTRRPHPSSMSAGGQALRPALLWMDMRSAAQAARVVEGAAGDPALAVNGAGRGPVSAEWMVPKALWLLEQEPLVFHQATFICEYQVQPPPPCACVTGLSTWGHKHNIRIHE